LQHSVLEAVAEQQSELLDLVVVVAVEPAVKEQVVRERTALRIPAEVVEDRLRMRMKLLIRAVPVERGL
jgi:hypothetical protein